MTELPASLVAALSSPSLYLPWLGITFLLWAFVSAAGRVIYNLFFHPLRRFPGPLVSRATNLWRISKLFSGNLHQSVRQLHEKYGPVVRIAPHELSFIEPQAWKDIYGHHNSYEMSKDSNFYRPMGKNVADTIISADRDHHSLLRRQLSHGFSDRSMRAQEPIFREYVDLLIQRLTERSDTGKPLDMRAWMNFTTFDVIGNLAFGSDFGCLENSSYHPWVEAITNNLRDLALMRGYLQFISTSLVFQLFRLGMFKGRRAHATYAKNKIQSRLEMTAERPDFIEGLLKKRDVLVSLTLQDARECIRLTAYLVSGRNRVECCAYCPRRLRNHGHLTLRRTLFARKTPRYP